MAGSARSSNEQRLWGTCITYASMVGLHWSLAFSAFKKAIPDLGKLKAVRSSVLIFLVLSLSSCVLLGPGRTVPHANYKLAVSENYSRTQVLELVDQVVKENGFIKVSTGWEDAGETFDAEIRDTLSKSIRYELNDLQISYFPNSTQDVQISFYEFGRGRFSESAIELYYVIREAMSDAGLEHLAESPDDVAAYRRIGSPEQFNERSDYSAFGYHAGWAFGIALGLGLYVFIVLIPVWKLLRKSLRNMSGSLTVKRMVFVALVVSFFYPLVIPLSMFGPVILFPGIVPAPLILLIATEFRGLIMGSIIVTLILSTPASFYYLKPVSETPPKE